MWLEHLLSRDKISNNNKKGYSDFLLESEEIEGVFLFFLRGFYFSALLFQLQSRSSGG